MYTIWEYPKARRGEGCAVPKIKKGVLEMEKQSKKFKAEERLRRFFQTEYLRENLSKLNIQLLASKAYMLYIDNLIWYEVERAGEDPSIWINLTNEGFELAKKRAWLKTIGREPNRKVVTEALKVQEILKLTKPIMGKFAKELQMYFGLLGDGAPSTHDIQGIYWKLWQPVHPFMDRLVSYRDMTEVSGISKGSELYYFLYMNPFTKKELDYWEGLFSKENGSSDSQEGDRFPYSWYNIVNTTSKCRYYEIPMKGEYHSLLKAIAKAESSFKNEGANMLLAAELKRWGYQESAFEFALNNTLIKKSNSIPNVDLVSGAYHLYRMVDGDPRGWTLGNHTDCCQRIGGAGESCAVYGMKEHNSAFFVVEKNGKDRIVSQAWAWRVDDILYLDNIESLSESDTIKQLWQEAATKLIGKLGICEVRVGLGHNDEIDNSDGKVGHLPNNHRRILGGSYTDASIYVILAKK